MDETYSLVTYTKEKQIPTSDFRLLFDVGKGKVSTRVLSYRPDTGEDGFFLASLPSLSQGRLVLDAEGVAHRVGYGDRRAHGVALAQPLGSERGERRRCEIVTRIS